MPTHSRLNEVKELLLFAGPIMLLGAGWVLMKLTDASIIGHLGADALAAASISDMYINCLTSFMQGRVLPTLVAQAMGAGNPALAGTWLMVAICVGTPLVALIATLMALSRIFYTFAGVPEPVASMAYTYSIAFIPSIPCVLLLGLLAAYLMARKIVRPTTYATVVGLVANLLLGVPAVYGFPLNILLPALGLPPFEGFGFVAAPLVTSFVQIATTGSLWMMALRQHLFDGAWPTRQRAALHAGGGTYDVLVEGEGEEVGAVGVNGKPSQSELQSGGVGGEDLLTKESDAKALVPLPATHCEFLSGIVDGLRTVTLERVKVYLRMYIPAALSISSDFWRVGAIGAITATIGMVSVGVFNISYRLLWLALLPISATGAATTVHVGKALGSGEGSVAKFSAHTGLMMMGSCSAATALAIIFANSWIARGFSSDPVVIDAFAEARFGIAGMLFAMTLSVGLEKLLVALGRTKVVLYCGLIGSWALQVPGVYILVNYYHASLSSVFYGAAFGYGVLCLLLVIAFSRTDWDEEAEAARKRSEIKSKEVAPPTPIGSPTGAGEEKGVEGGNPQQKNCCSECGGAGSELKEEVVVGAAVTHSSTSRAAGEVKPGVADAVDHAAVGVEGGCCNGGRCSA